MIKTAHCNAPVSLLFDFDNPGARIVQWTSLSALASEIFEKA